MTLTRELAAGLRRLLRRGDAERDLDDEVAHFLAMAAREHERAGLPPDEALRAARLWLGGVESVKERVRGGGWEASVEALGRDVRYAMRGAGVDSLAVLKESGGRQGMRERRGWRARGTLVAAELAFALLLLTGAVLMLNSFARLTRVPRNYDPRSIFAVNVVLPATLRDRLGPGPRRATSSDLGSPPARAGVRSGGPRAAARVARSGSRRRGQQAARDTRVGSDFRGPQAR